MSKNLLTGIKPTGQLHLGNYIGAIKPILSMADDPDYDAYVFVANYHALNSGQPIAEIRDNTYNVMAAFLALRDKTDISMFLQSDVPETFELVTILNNVVGKGLMDRSHAYKDIVAKNIDNGADPDRNVNMGLYTYPILMAADILIHDTDVVPVGKDQLQHLNITSDIAGHFNNAYGTMFKIPKALVREDIGSLPGTDGRKMSKSYNNIIPLFADRATLEKIIKGFKTDSKGKNEPKNPDELDLYSVLKHFASDNVLENTSNALKNGEMGYGDLKAVLVDTLDTYFAESRKAYDEFRKDVAYMRAAFSFSNSRNIARDKLKEVKKVIGI